MLYIAYSLKWLKSSKSTKYIYIIDLKPRCKYSLLLMIMLNNLDNEEVFMLHRDSMKRLEFMVSCRCKEVTGIKEDNLLLNSKFFVA